MTIFMTFSIYSLRVSSDMPTQSQYLPMVTLYFLLGITYTFMAYMWFILANEYQTKGNMPQVFAAFVPYVKRTLFWIFKEDPWWKRSKQAASVVPQDTRHKIIEEHTNPDSQSVFMTKISATSEVTSPVNNQDNVNKPMESITLPPLYKCHNCDFCEKCLKNKKLEKEAKSKKQLIDENLSAINYFACFVLFWIMLGCNLFVWLLVSNPPASY